MLQSMEPEQLPTTGGEVTVTGKNFGRPGYAACTVLDEDGDTVSSITAAVDPDYTQTEMRVTVSEGQGKLQLQVNVSGQVDTFALTYQEPEITSISPASGPTTGTNVTLTGTNFGTFVGTDVYTLSVGDDTTIMVLESSHTSIVFAAPEGQSARPLDVNLTVGEQAANTVTFSYDTPELYHIADSDTYEPLLETYCADDVDDSCVSPSCDRYDEDGCGLSTDGGYEVALVGTNFGMAAAGVQTVYFDGGAMSVTILSHTKALVTIPEGTGTNIPIAFEIGTGAVMTSNELSFSYDPPYITEVSPNTPDAEGDTISIYGNNFGSSLATAGKISVRIGGEPCLGVSASSTDDDDGESRAEIWQESSSAGAYLWCQSARLTVGSQAVEVTVAGQNVSWSVDDEKVTTQCEVSKGVVQGGSKGGAGPGWRQMRDKRWHRNSSLSRL